MEKQHAKDFLKKYITVTGGPAAVDALDDENKGGKAKEFVKKYFTVVGGPEAIDAVAEQKPKYLTMTLPEGSPRGGVIFIRKSDSLNKTLNFQYRVNNGDWIDWNFAKEVPAFINVGDVVQWKGVNSDGLSTGINDHVHFVTSTEVNLSGNVMSLIDGVGKTKVIPCDYCFSHLFSEAQVKYVSEDLLPATTLTKGCYYSMFYARQSLVNAPELPATTLADSCYKYMFFGCSSLVSAPKILPATTLANSCYYYMFQTCSSLVDAPVLPATTLANSCYNCMFQGCRNLQNVTCLATDISAPGCISGWLTGVASTGTFNKAAGVEWPIGGYDGIPSGWTINEPEQPEQPEQPEIEGKYLTMTLPEGSPTTQISIIKTNPNLNTNIKYRVNNGKWTDWDFTSSQAISANANDVIQWKGVNPNGLSTSSSGSFVFFQIPNEVHLSGNVMSLIDGVGDTKVIPCSYCFYGLFRGTRIKTISEDFLPATTLTEHCYESMFQECTSLENAPELPATTLANSCYYYMFISCSKLVNAPKILHATTLADSCCYYMFTGCSSLVSAPKLPATTLTNNCYNGMFQGCSKLQNITCLATNISASGCTSMWLAGVASTGTFIKASGFDGWSTGVNGIPSGWTVNEK